MRFALRFRRRRHDRFRDLARHAFAGVVRRRLDVTCDHVTTGLQAMRHLPGVRTATVFGQSMHLLVDETMREEFIRERLAQAGIPHADIHPIGPSLEDVFVALTSERSPKNGQGS